MLNQYFWQILVVLSLLIVVLATLAYRLWRGMENVKKAELEKKQELALKDREREEFVEESLRIIGKAVLEKQCEISEGCIRIRMLLNRTSKIDVTNPNFNTFYELYEEIKHFKTHQERKELSKQARFIEDKERFEIEDRYRDSMFEATRELLKSLESLN